MPQRPKDTEHQCSPDGIESKLQPWKGKPAPADLLEEPDDDHGREEEEGNRPPICVVPGPTDRRPGCDGQCRREASKDKWAEQRDDVPEWMHPPASQLPEQGPQLMPSACQESNDHC